MKNSEKANNICTAIYDIINKQQLKPGDRLPAERYLAEQLKVSRNSVREALHMLEAKNYIISKRGSGTYVNFPTNIISIPFTNTSSLQTLINILNLRTILESYGFIEVSKTITESQLKKLRQLEEEIYTNILDSSIENKPFTSIPVTFEEAIMALQRNEYLIQIHSYLCESWKKCLGQTVMVSMSALARHKQHLAILKSISEKKSDKIKKAVEYHHEQTKKNIKYFLDHIK